MRKGSFGLIAFAATCATAALLSPARAYEADLSLVDASAIERTRLSLPYPPPYAARYDDGRKRLTFIAARHGEDPETYQLIDDEFSALHPQLLIIEGVRTDQSTAEWLRMADSGKLEGTGWEPIHAARLARKAGIPIIGGEPSPEEEQEGVRAAGYASTDYQGYALLRGVAFRREKHPEQGFEEDFAESSRDYASHFPVEAARSGLMTPRAFLAWYEALQGRPLDFERLKLADSSPSGRSAVQKIGLASSLARDRHIARLLADELGQADRILIVYGSDHHVELAPALEKMVGRARYVLAPLRLAQRASEVSDAQLSMPCELDRSRRGVVFQFPVAGLDVHAERSGGAYVAHVYRYGHVFDAGALVKTASFPDLSALESYLASLR